MQKRSNSFAAALRQSKVEWRELDLFSKGLSMACLAQLIGIAYESGHDYLNRVSYQKERAEIPPVYMDLNEKGHLCLNLAGQKLYDELLTFTQSK